MIPDWESQEAVMTVKVDDAISYLSWYLDTQSEIRECHQQF